jgi:UDP-2,4-diacetamido-2,4,6-trideoxy-beta-L-altropyranose hydrolase
MNVIFRTDASLDIGIGHVMRCLTLAQALSDLGANCRFICREHTGNLLDIIRQRSFEVQSLSIKYSSQVNLVQQSVQGERVLPHAAWLGVDWQTDAEETKNVIGDGVVDWLIVDHYALDIGWETSLKSHYQKLMVIDDLADRAHDCDLLLDQTFGRDAADYQHWVPVGCPLLIGSNYALLRPEFAAFRDFSLARRQSSELKHLLITMGGVDKGNFTGQVLAALLPGILPEDCRVTVVMGATAPWFEAVELQAKRLPWQVEVKVNVSDMAQLMADTDLVVGAAGSTSWERCCLGVPTLMLVTADNQQEVARSLELSGAAICLSSASPLEVELAGELAKLRRSKDALSVMSIAARGVSDGLGAQRAAKFLLELDKKRSVSLRAASEADCDLVFQLQSHLDIRRYFNNPQVPSYQEHCDWYSNCLERSDRQLFIVLFDGDPAGILRLDDEGSDIYEVSIITAEAYQGQGVAKSALLLVREAQPGSVLAAVVNKGNLASKRLFETVGYEFNGMRFISLP